ncbi:MAG: zinc-ribbon domain-containing protein [Caldilineaceae bacterium]|nr:zinc-ribbon domain-containing protein [Caldilineaceae bacterium]
MPNTIRCPHCGISNRSGSNFCNACGASLRSDVEARTTTDPDSLDEQITPEELQTPGEALQACRIRISQSAKAQQARTPRPNPG